MLIFVVIMSTAVLYVPGISVEKAEQSAWISAIISVIPGLIALWLANELGKRFPKETLVQYAELLLGKFLGKAASIGFLFSLFTIEVIMIAEFSSFINVILMPETPALVLNALLAIIAAYAAVKGIEVIARVTQFILPMFLISLMLILVLSVIDMKIGNLFPIMEPGLLSIIDSSIISGAWMGQIAILTLLFPMLNIPQEALSKGIKALLAASALLAVLTAVTICIFGAKLPGDLLFPFFSLAKYVKFTMIQRLEFLVIFIWVSGIVVKAAVFFCLESTVIMQTFSLKNKTMIYSFLIISQTVLATFAFGNPQDISQFLATIWPIVMFSFELGLLAGLLLIALIRKKKVVLQK